MRPYVPIDRATAMTEIAAALRPEFLPKGGLTPRDDAPNIMVNMGRGAKPVSIRFSTRALERYMAGDDAFRQRARTAVARVCHIRMGMEYVGNADPLNVFVI